MTAPKYWRILVGWYELCIRMSMNTQNERTWLRTADGGGTAKSLPFFVALNANFREE